MNTLLNICAALVLQSPAGALSTNDPRPFPFIVENRGTVQLIPDASRMASLESLENVRLARVPWPGAANVTEMVSVNLRRVRVDRNKTVVTVDDVATNRRLEQDLTMWAGKVDGEADSDVFLAFSPFGSRGWIQRGKERFEILAMPGAGGGWENSTSIVVSAANLKKASPGPICAPMALPSVPTVTSPPTAAAPPPPSVMSVGTGPAIFFSTTVAVESDYYYYTKFGSVPAATTYASTLFGAVAARYADQVSVGISVTYLGIHSTSSDGWVAQETAGATAATLVSEFKTKWGKGGAPVAANLYHYLSTFVWPAPSAAGIGYFADFCNPPSTNDSNFAVSTMMSGTTTFPVTVGPLSFDFTLVAHEMGHNYHAIHTHAYCPPLDKCADPATTGDTCYTGSPVCITTGTIMSYCQTCPGGSSNITLFFHPQSVADMRAFLMSNCAGIPAGTSAHASLPFAPIGGVPHEDVRLTQFVDLDLTAGIKDFGCGTLTYDGSKGIAFDIPGFTQQDIGVPVFAVADGVVLEVENTISDLNAGGGCSPPYTYNRVVMNHGSGLSVTYGMLKKGSISVLAGQRVRAGEQIGLAGSSGCTSWPRVYFEAHGPSGIIDPDAGTCNVPSVAWASTIGKPTTPALTSFVLSRQNPPATFPPYATPNTGQFATSDTVLWYVTMLNYIPASGTLRHRILRPNGSTYADYTYSFGNASPIYTGWYYWTWSVGGTLTPTGTWTLKLDVGTTNVLTSTFDVVTTYDGSVNHAPAAPTIAFSPAAPKVTDSIICKITSVAAGNDLDYDVVRYRYKWKVNGSIVRNVVSAGRADILPHHTALDGQTVSCEVTPNDGKVDGTTTTLSVAIAATADSVSYDSVSYPNSGILSAAGSVSNASGVATFELFGGVPFEGISMGYSDNFAFEYPLAFILPGNPGSLIIDIATSAFTENPDDLFGPGGNAKLAIPFPPSPSLIGREFLLQWLSFDPSAVVLLSSKGLKIKIVP